ncbi:ABC transporter permease, partial [Thioclava sp. BHET1]
MFENRSIGLALVLPAALFAALVFLVPVVVLLGEGLHPNGGWSLSAYAHFFHSHLNRIVLWRTLELGAAVTVAAGVIGYAAAYAIVTLPEGGKGRMIGLIVLPLMISPVARTYAW